MLTKLILALVGVAAMMEQTWAQQDLRLLENEDADDLDEDDIIEAVEDEIDSTEDLKVFERAKVPSDKMYFKSPTYQGKNR